MSTNRSVFNKIGLPRHLAWGYLGILIFMMGDGMETGWLSPYLIDRGMSMQQTALLFSVYGVTIAIWSWFSGVLAETYGPKKSMAAGLVFYLLGTAGFIALGMVPLDFPVMLATYALRGFGYPLFAYSFLVWISYASPKNMLGRAGPAIVGLFIGVAGAEGVIWILAALYLLSAVLTWFITIPDSGDVIDQKIRMRVVVNANLD